MINEREWESEMNTKFIMDWEQNFQHFSFKSVSKGLQEHALKVSQRWYYRLPHLITDSKNCWKGCSELGTFIQ